MSRREGKRPRSRSNSPVRRNDRDEDRKHHKSHRRSPSKDRDHRSHKSSSSSSSRRHDERRSRSRSPKDSRRDGRESGSHRSERSSKPSSSSARNEPSTSASSAPAVLKPELVEKALEQLVGNGLDPTVAAKRAAEQAQLDEEIRKRREKVKAWQEAKRLKEEQEKGVLSADSNTVTSGSAETALPSSMLGTAGKGGSTSTAEVNNERGASSEASTEQIQSLDAEGPSERAHGWNLEDDDEEDEGNIAPADTGGEGNRNLPAPASPEHVATADVAEAAVFQRLASTPVKSHTHSEHALAQAHHPGSAVAHLTAAHVAVSVSGGAASSTSSSSATVSSSNHANAAVGTKKRLSRLKASKWDSDQHGDDGDTTTSENTSRTGVTAPTNATGAVPARPVVANNPVPVAEEEEIDPLEAFMSSLYDTGDVAAQKDLPSEKGVPHGTGTSSGGAGGNGNGNGNGRPGMLSITLEEILAGTGTGSGGTGSNGNGSSVQAGGLNSGQVTSGLGGRDPAYTSSAGGTPPSPQFAPALKNYPSSSSLMAKSPSLRTLSATMSTSFDNMNRGWESDAPDMNSAGFTIGNEGMGVDGDDADGMDDNGEVPWHLMSSTEKKKLQHRDSDRMDVVTSAATASGGATAGVQGLSESEAENEGDPAETEEEREARELREKQEFIEAFRRARAEEDAVHSRLSRLDESAAAAAALANSSTSTAGKGTSSQGGAGSTTSTSDATSGQPNNGSQLGRIFSGDGDMVEEHELDTKRRSALEILEDAKKGKMLKEIDHSKVQYIPFRKNLYIVPRALSKLTEADVLEKREDLQVKVRGKACPVPVDTWEQCGLSDRVLQTVYNLQLKEPFPIQKQAIPAIMCGRDVIGVAKTGSGKTLAFLLPMLRHILDQPPLMDGEGPIGLIMAPARELASQIYQEAKKFTKPLGLRVTCIYGGAGVAEQIADLKRGSEIVVCTPGRMIDILCMQAGKLVSLKRVTMVVMDEADRMFDMGFEPQIKMIIQNVRPDRQTVLFSATFPKQIEKLARSVLRLPLEIIVGERSTVNKDITQVVEVHEEEDKFLRLLQLLGVWYEKGSVLIFVDKQEKCDQLFQDLLKLGYPCLSLHGGKDQVDRDHTLHEFKTGVKTVMVATSVAGRGLDVPDIVCVVNYHCPNHVEDYVHRVGRTGRAGRKGTAYTFVSQREEQYAPSMVKVLQKAGQTVPQELTDLSEAFRAKVSRGEAHWVSTGFEGKGFTFDASEMNETQKIANMQKKAYEREQGLAPTDTGADADDEDDDFGAEDKETLQRSTNTSSAALSSLATAVAPVAPAASAGGAVSGPPVMVAPVFTPEMTPLERAKALAASIAANRAAGGTGTIPPAAPIASSAPAGPIDPQAALARAKLIALQMAAAGKAGAAAAEEHYTEEVEINDYPHQARRKVTNKASMDDICDRTGVAVISRGAFVPAGKKLEPGERKLHLLIEGSNEMSVKQARLEILKVLEDETIRISASGSLATSGRYSVI